MSIKTPEVPNTGQDADLLDEKVNPNEDDLLGENEPKPEDKPDLDYEIELPEGKEMAEEEVKSFKELAKDLGLSKEQAQKLLGKQLEQSGQQEAKVQAQLAELSNQWIQKVKEDPEIGGPKLAETIQNSKLVLNKFASEEMKGIIKGAKLSNNPEFLRFLNNIGKAIGNDKFVGLDNLENHKDRSAADILYPKA